MEQIIEKLRLEIENLLKEKQIRIKLSEDIKC